MLKFQLVTMDAIWDLAKNFRGNNIENIKIQKKEQ